MAKVAVICPSCCNQYQVEENLLGRRARCKHCQTRFALSRADKASATASAVWPWVTSNPSSVVSADRTAPRQSAQPPEELVPAIWQPGDVILDLYEVREVFTSGGMGLVYWVWHRGWNLDLAVKCPRPEHFRNERDKENFEREALTWVQLGLHPHTVTCYYVRRLGGIPRVFAEYVAGGSLAEWIRTKKLYDGGTASALERLLDVAIQFAWGLQHAHEQGLVHRDVKPGNVLMTPDGIAKVTDFGMAKARGATAEMAAPDQAGSVLVTAGGMTPAFCSPEQVLGQRVSRKTDIWSWAVSVLEMFRGAASLSAGYLAAEALRHYLEWGPPQPYLPALPPALAHLLQRCFQRDPEARPENMPAVVAVLQEVYQQVTGRAYPREPPLAAEALADGLNNRAVSLLDLDKQAEAEQHWEEALSAGPNHPESTYNLGLSRWRAGRISTQALVQKLQEVCASHPEDWWPLYLLAQVHLETCNWRAAIDALERITGAAAALDEVRAALATARERQAALQRCLRTVALQADSVSSAWLSSDGRLALSGSADKTLKLWEISSGRCLRTFEGHTEWVTSVWLSSDGRYALSGSADRTLKLWGTATGHCLRTLQGHTKWVLAVSMGLDGRYALSGGGDGLVKLWDPDSGALVANCEGHRDPVLCVGWSQDGRLALSGSRDTTLKLWDVPSGQCLRTFSGHGDRVLAVCFSGDGRYALSGSGDRTVKLWELETGQCLRTFQGHADGVFSVSLSHDGRYALSGSGDRTVKLWRLSMDQCLCTLEGHTGTVNAVGFAADGRRALSASGDRTCRVWRLPKDTVAPLLVSRILASHTALAARSRYEQALARAWQAVSAGDALAAAQCVRQARSQPGYARRLEAMNQWSALYVRLPRQMLKGAWEGNTLEGHLDPVTCVSVSGDGRYILSGGADRTLKLWEAATGQCLRTLEGHASAVTSGVLSRDGHYALSGSADYTLRLWETLTGRCLETFDGHRDAVTSVSLSADGRYGLSASADRTVKLWEIPGGRCLRTLTGHTQPILAACLSPDALSTLSGGGQFLIRNDSERLFLSGQLKLWETATGRPLPTFESHAEAVTSVCLGIEGRYALSGGGQSVIDPQTGKSSQSGRLHFWELATGRCLSVLEGHADAVTSVALSADSRFALSGSMDRSMKLWEVADGRCLRTFAGHSDAITAIAFAGDGRYAVSASADRTLKLWILDWELQDRQPADWDEGARSYLEMFLHLHTPYAVPSGPERSTSMRALLYFDLARWFGAARPGGIKQTASAGPQAVGHRRGRPVWTDEDFENLLYLLGCAGYGWLRPEGVRSQLAQMASSGASQRP